MRVLRCGMGLERARVAAARALAVEDAVAVAIAGVCAAAAPALRPGDVVLGTELRRQDGPPVAVPGSALLAAALRRHGLRVHVGPIACVDRVLSPTERRGLGARGALAVDMESAWLAGGAGGRPLVVMRVVVERSDRSLHDPRTAAAGIRALASLRRASAALSEWAAAVGPRRLLLAGPRSFCAAVAREAEPCSWPARMRPPTRSGSSRSRGAKARPPISSRVSATSISPGSPAWQRSGSPRPPPRRRGPSRAS